MAQMDAEGKLVRDRIPEIIEAAGGQATTRVLVQAERCGFAAGVWLEM